jgi:hypothetical protein
MVRIRLAFPKHVASRRAQLRIQHDQGRPPGGHVPGKVVIPVATALRRADGRHGVVKACGIGTALSYARRTVGDIEMLVLTGGRVADPQAGKLAKTCPGICPS